MLAMPGVAAATGEVLAVVPLNARLGCRRTGTDAVTLSTDRSVRCCPYARLEALRPPAFNGLHPRAVCVYESGQEARLHLLLHISLLASVVSRAVVPWPAERLAPLRERCVIGEEKRRFKPTTGSSFNHDAGLGVERG